MSYSCCHKHLTYADGTIKLELPTDEVHAELEVDGLNGDGSDVLEMNTRGNSVEHLPKHICAYDLEIAIVREAGETFSPVGGN